MACKNFIDFLYQRCLFIYLLFIFRTKKQHQNLKLKYMKEVVVLTPEENYSQISH